MRQTGLGTEQSLTLNGAVGDSIRCIVKGTDAHGGVFTAQQLVEIENRAPGFADGVSIQSSGETYSNSSLSCDAVGQDLDGDQVTVSYQWYSKEVEIAQTSDITLSPEQVQPGDNISCVATVLDEHGESHTETAAVQIVNSVPQFTQEPLIQAGNAPLLTETITCEALATDPDLGDVTID